MIFLFLHHLIKKIQIKIAFIIDLKLEKEVNFLVILKNIQFLKKTKNQIKVLFAILDIVY